MREMGQRGSVILLLGQLRDAEYRDRETAGADDDAHSDDAILRTWRCGTVRLGPFVDSARMRYFQTLNRFVIRIGSRCLHDRVAILDETIPAQR